MAQGGSGVISDPEAVLEAYKQVRSDENDILWYVNCIAPWYIPWLQLSVG